MAPKKISRKRIMQQFVKLPEAKRIELLSKNLSPDVIAELAADEFYKPIFEIRSKPKKEGKAFLMGYFGDTKEHLKQALKHGENFLTLMKESEYAQFGARTDEDKLHALVCGETMTNRLRIFYDDLYEKDRQPFIRKALKSINSIELASKYLGNPQNYAPGKTPEDFLKDVAENVDLSREPSLMEELRTVVPANDPKRKEKLQCVAQKYMLFDEGQLDLKDLREKLQGKDWEQNFDIQKDLEFQDSCGYFQAEHVLQRVKAAVNDIPETEEEKTAFKEAALQICRDYKDFKRFYEKDINDLDQDKKDFIKYTNELQEDLAAEGLKQQDIRNLRESLAGEYDTLAKVKTGWFLSSTNSPEYNNMMKHLKLFGAKLDLISGQNPGDLTPEELKIVQETDVDVLLANAKQGCYNYGSIKVKNGTGSIWHGAGTNRFNSSMKTLSQLGEIGKKLHLSNSAAALRDEAQLQALQHRRDSDWLKENIEDVVAKTICAQVSLNNKTPAYQQRRELEGDALKAHVEKIKANKDFRKMMQSVSKEQLADAVIEGGNSLYEVFNMAADPARAEGRQRTASEITPESIKQRKEAPGLVPGYHK